MKFKFLFPLFIASTIFSNIGYCGECEWDLMTPIQVKDLIIEPAKATLRAIQSLYAQQNLSLDDFTRVANDINLTLIKPNLADFLKDLKSLNESQVHSGILKTGTQYFELMNEWYQSHGKHTSETDRARFLSKLTSTLPSQIPFSKSYRDQVKFIYLTMWKPASNPIDFWAALDRDIIPGIRGFEEVSALENNEIDWRRYRALRIFFTNIAHRLEFAISISPSTPDSVELSHIALNQGREMFLEYVNSLEHPETTVQLPTDPLIAQSFRLEISKDSSLLPYNSSFVMTEFSRLVSQERRREFPISVLPIIGTKRQGALIVLKSGIEAIRDSTKMRIFLAGTRVTLLGREGNLRMRSYQKGEVTPFDVFLDEGIFPSVSPLSAAEIESISEVLPTN